MFIKKFLALNTKKHLKNNKTKRNPSGFQEAKHIGIIFTIEDLEKHKAVKAFKKELEETGKEVDVIAYLEKGKENHEFLFDFITAQEVSIWGVIKNKHAIAFAQANFDYLFHIDKKRNDILENIVARSQAKCRIGIHNNDNSDFYELIIHQDTDKSEENIISELHFYAQKITGHEK